MEDDSDMREVMAFGLERLGARLLATAHSSRCAHTEVYVIHEMLHTLGLGENPSDSHEITQHMQRGCAP